MDGFYVAYLTGVSGSSLAVFTFMRGVVAGADVGGVLYEGTYKLDEAQSQVVGYVNYKIPAGVGLITGRVADDSAKLSIPFSISSSFANGDVVKIDTPNGPVNAKFQKIRGAEGV